MIIEVLGAGLGASLLFGLIGMAPAGVIIAMSEQALRPQVRAFGMGIFFTVYYASCWSRPQLQAQYEIRQVMLWGPYGLPSSCSPW